MARRVRFFESQIQKEKDVVPIRPLYDSAPLITVGPSAAHTIDELEVTLAGHETRLLQMNDSYKTLSERTRELVEARHVLRETAVFFEKVSLAAWWGYTYDILTDIMKAETQQTDIRTSFDDSSAPLLQHDDREQQYSSTLQFDLECADDCPHCYYIDADIDSLLALLTAPVFQHSSASYGVF